MASTANCVPKVMIIGDSIPYGVGSPALPGWRRLVYDDARTLGRPLYLVGSQSFSGTGGVFAIDPYMECVPGAEVAVSGETLANRIVTYTPDLAVLQLGTNDLDAGAGNKTPAQLAVLYSSLLDYMWARRTRGAFRIVCLTLLLRYDGQDARVIAFNALLPGILASKSYSAHLTLVNVNGANLIYPTDFTDPVHPNVSGATKLGDYLAPYFVNAAYASVSLINDV